MEPQNENLGAPIAQQPSPQNFFEKNKLLLIVGLVVLILLAIGGIYLVNNKPTPQSSTVPVNETANQTHQTQLQSGNFRDDELGISFQIPESWGNATVKNDFSSTQILREISFSNQPNVKLVSFTEHRLYPANFQKEGILSGTDIKASCEAQKEYLAGGEEPKTSNGQDIFKQNGAYNFGNCDTNPTFLNISQKKSSQDGGWIPLNDPRPNIISPIELSRSYTWDLQNNIYGALTLKADVPDIQSDGFCITQFYYGGNDYRLSKKLSGCINHKEKGLIEATFRDFDSVQLAKEVNSLVSSLQTYSADKATSIYDNYFKDKAVFRDTGLGISFSYPSVFGQPKYDVNTRVLKFPNDENDVLRVEVNTLADIVQAEKEVEACEGSCLVPLTSQERWKKEKDMLAQGSLGQFQCSFGGQYCEIANVGNTKMLVRYYGQWPRTEGIRKEYTFYIDDKRFDLLTNSYGVFTSDLAEYRKVENTDFTLKLVREILESIRVEK